MEVKQYGFATYFRVLGVILILLCHFVQQSTNTYLNLTAQFFNIGVNMFFILSGFLFGIRGLSAAPGTKGLDGREGK